MNKEIHIAVIDSGLVTNLLCETARICEYTTLHLKNQMDSNQWELEICRDGNPIETGEISHGTLVVNTVLKYAGDIPLAFHIYDVFDEKDASAGSVLLEALNMILKEDIDIVVMSLTCSSQYENDFIELSGKLKEKNVLMFCSDSNDGRTHCPANLDFIYGVTGDKADASGRYTYEVGKKIQFHCDLSGEFVGDPGKYHFFVGTSKATAMVAGKLAKYLYENGRNALIDYLSCDQEEWDARTEEFDAGCVNSKLLSRYCEVVGIPEEICLENMDTIIPWNQDNIRTFTEFLKQFDLERDMLHWHYSEFATVRKMMIACERRMKNASLDER